MNKAYSMKKCRATTQSGTPCRNKASRFGVCKVHPKWAHCPEGNPIAIEYVKECVENTKAFLHAYNLCTALGKNPVCPYGMNLCRTIDPNSVSDPEHKAVCLALESSRQLSLTYQYRLATGDTSWTHPLAVVPCSTSDSLDHLNIIAMPENIAAAHLICNLSAAIRTVILSPGCPLTPLNKLCLEYIQHLIQ